MERRDENRGNEVRFYQKMMKETCLKQEMLQMKIEWKILDEKNDWKENHKILERNMYEYSENLKDMMKEYSDEWICDEMIERMKFWILSNWNLKTKKVEILEKDRKNPNGKERIYVHSEIAKVDGDYESNRKKQNAAKLWEKINICGITHINQMERILKGIYGKLIVMYKKMEIDLHHERKEERNRIEKIYEILQKQIQNQKIEKEILDSYGLNTIPIHTNNMNESCLECHNRMYKELKKRCSLSIDKEDLNWETIFGIRRDPIPEKLRKELLESLKTQKMTIQMILEHFDWKYDECSNCKQMKEDQNIQQTCQNEIRMKQSPIQWSEYQNCIEKSYSLDTNQKDELKKLHSCDELKKRIEEHLKRMDSIQYWMKWYSEIVPNVYHTMERQKELMKKYHKNRKDQLSERIVDSIENRKAKLEEWKEEDEKMKEEGHSYSVQMYKKRNEQKQLYEKWIQYEEDEKNEIYDKIWKHLIQPLNIYYFEQIRNVEQYGLYLKYEKGEPVHEKQDEWLLHEYHRKMKELDIHDIKPIQTRITNNPIPIQKSEVKVKSEVKLETPILKMEEMKKHEWKIPTMKLRLEQECITIHETIRERIEKKRHIEQMEKNYDYIYGKLYRKLCEGPKGYGIEEQWTQFRKEIQNYRNLETLPEIEWMGKSYKIEELIKKESIKFCEEMCQMYYKERVKNSIINWNIKSIKRREWEEEIRNEMESDEIEDFKYHGMERGIMRWYMKMYQEIQRIPQGQISPILNVQLKEIEKENIWTDYYGRKGSNEKKMRRYREIVEWYQNRSILVEVEERKEYSRKKEEREKIENKIRLNEQEIRQIKENRMRDVLKNVQELEKEKMKIVEKWENKLDELEWDESGKSLKELLDFFKQ